MSTSAGTGLHVDAKRTRFVAPECERQVEGRERVPAACRVERDRGLSFGAGH